MRVGTLGALRCLVAQLTAPCKFCVRQAITSPHAAAQELQSPQQPASRRAARAVFAGGVRGARSILSSYAAQTLYLPLVVGRARALACVGRSRPLNRDRGGDYRRVYNFCNFCGQVGRGATCSELISATHARIEVGQLSRHAAVRGACSLIDAQKVILGRPVDPTRPPSSTSPISHPACSRVRAQDGPRRRQAVAHTPGGERRPRGGRRCAAAGRPQRPSGSRFCRFSCKSAIFAPRRSP